MTDKAVSRHGDTVIFERPPAVRCGAAVCGPKEGEGPLGSDMDRIFPSLRWGEHSFEQCEQQMQEAALRIVLDKAGLRADDIDLLCGGDLINQITPSSNTALALHIPFAGLFSACATSVQALGLAALACGSGAARRALAFAGSHTCTAERQFRYPNEYGAQKPPYAQQTATACGAALLCAADALPAGTDIAARVTAFTLGRVCDARLTDPFQLGAAMAPAFAASLTEHLRQRGAKPADFDLILSGDLGRDGCAVAQTLLRRQGTVTDGACFGDCGLLLFGGYDSLVLSQRTEPLRADELRRPPTVARGSVFAGGSGCGCAAAVGCGHLLRRMQQGELRRVLLCATGALLSPQSVQQGGTIPAVCHVLELEAPSAALHEAFLGISSAVGSAAGAVSITDNTKINPAVDPEEANRHGAV